MDDINDLLRQVSASKFVTFGTSAPYTVSRPPYLERIGFASIPVVGVEIVGAEDTAMFTAIARQLVLRELADRGLGHVRVSLIPTVGGSYRKRKFKDTNERSGSFGRMKFGRTLDFHFEIERGFVSLFYPLEGGSKLAWPKKE
jgi:hypothetical protein